MDSVTICNIALSAISQGQIASLDEASAEAQHCKLHYDTARDLLLSGFDWNFARRRRDMTLLDGDPPVVWSYQYSYPSDCLNFLYIQDPTARRTSTPAPFEVAVSDDLTDRVIYTDIEDAVGVYTARITNPNLFTPKFIDALSWEIAARIVVPITNSDAKLTNCVKMADFKLQIATAGNANEAQRDDDPDGSLLSARA